MTAVPTALVAAAGRLPSFPGRRHHRRRRSVLPGGSRSDLMKVARGAAAAVSAITVVMDVASELSKHKDGKQ